MNSNDYVKAIEKMNVPDGMKDRIKDRTLKYGERKNVNMSKRKFIAIAAAAVMVFSVGVYAATGGLIKGWFSSSNALNDYKTLPTAEQCLKDCGYTPTLIDEFENGYKFINGSIVNNTLTDENNNAMEKFKSFDFRYGKGDDTVYFSQKKYTSQSENYAEFADEQDGVTIYYHSYENKFVPPDYEMTEEDKKAEESGELVFSYGSDEVEQKTISGAMWSVDDMHYTLMQMGGKLTKEELIDMAKEAIKN